MFFSLNNIWRLILNLLSARRLLILEFVILVTPLMVQLQTVCDKNLSDAEQNYNTGRFEEAIGLINECLDKAAISKQEKIRAYRLLGLAFIAIDNMDEARNAVNNLLEVFPNYIPDPIQDPPPFTTLVEKMRPKSVVKIEEVSFNTESSNSTISKILMIKNELALIDAGSENGVNIDDECDIYSSIELGQNLGKKLGTGRVTRTEPNRALINLNPKKYTLGTSGIIKKVESEISIIQVQSDTMMKIGDMCKLSPKLGEGSELVEFNELIIEATITDVRRKYIQLDVGSRSGLSLGQEYFILIDPGDVKLGDLCKFPGKKVKSE